MTTNSLHSENGADEDQYSLQLRCRTIVASGTQFPSPRSAHNLLASRDGSLVLLAGDSGVACQRFSDTWIMKNPAAAVIPAWQHLTQSGSYTARSNAAAATAGDWLLLFGGWDNTGLQPLAQLEVLNLKTYTWHKPCTTGVGPSARGQPAAAVDTAGAAVYVFGGWDGQQRYNDLYKLTVGQWHWEQVVPAAAASPATAAVAAAAAAGGNQHSVATAEVVLPCSRADHVMVCWHYCDDGTWKDLLVVFGGSSSDGLLNDTWLFDINTNSWTQAYYGGSAPCPRSSCAAAITGDSLLIHGGQTQSVVLQDMYLLQLSNLTWIQVDLGPVLQPLCRHSMAIAGEACWVFGGHDGCSCSNGLLQIDLQPVLQLQRSSLQDMHRSMACCGSSISSSSNSSSSSSSSRSTVGSSTGAAAAGPVVSAAALRVLHKKASPAPLTLADLKTAEDVAAMPQWKQIRHLHQAALAAGCDMYLDPKTGYSVFTAQYLQKRQCCGNKCRHCPHGWKNVVRAGSQQTAAAGAAPDW